MLQNLCGPALKSSLCSHIEHYFLIQNLPQVIFSRRVVSSDPGGYIMTLKRKKELYLDAVRAMFGFNKKEAVAYIRESDLATLAEVRAWWLEQCTLAFYND